MIALKAHFDGKVFVPDEPLDLAPNQVVRITVEPVEPSPRTGVDLRWLLGKGLSSGTNPNPRFNSNDDLYDKSK
jgi:hypothetical protein